jgi:YidC/Oxa1 family membrane protein insertase
MEERRLLLAVALSLLVLTAYQMLFPPPPRPVARPLPSPAPSAAPKPQPQAAAPEPAPPRVEIADTQERRVEVEGKDVLLALTNRGARLVAWRLQQYHDSRGRPEDMVQAVPGGARPLDLETGDEAVDARLRGALFRASAERVELPAEGETRLGFRYSDAELEVEKTLVFRPRGYFVGVEARVSQSGKRLPVRLVWGPGIGNPTAAEREVRGYQGPDAVVLARGEVVRYPAAKLQAPQPLVSARFIGIESHYFAALWVPAQGDAQGEIRARPLPPYEDGAPRVAPEALVALEPAGRVELYVGPKDYQTLSRVSGDLARVVPIGEWIGPLVVPLLGLLRLVHGYIGNYGWSIVALTLLINLVLGPLRHYSIKNGIKMSKLQPEMRVIQERYRKVPALDPRRQEMQEEIQALYARHGMSMGTQMAVGCLPILLTMPFLFAFYRVLDVSIDLRGAGFLWIADLSQKDPLFVTPLLMGVSMFVMQRMTPTTMDPAQQRMMTLMPLLLVGMFFWAPAGLNLYWLASNACSIAQQALTQRILRGEQRAEPKEKRRR